MSSNSSYQPQQKKLAASQRNNVSGLPKSSAREHFIATAESYLGYTARANGTSTFGDTVGYSGTNTPWDGAFIDVVAREAGLRWKSHVYSPQALSNYITDARLFSRPKRGDIVFFETPTVGDFSAPHVGIVTDVDRFTSDGVFSTIEAQTSSGLPKGSPLHDGVYRRIRSNLTVMTFARPDYSKTQTPTPQNGEVAQPSAWNNLPTVKAAQVKPKMRHQHIAPVQLALAKVTGVRNLPRGFFDEKTRSAYAKFQRSIGVLNANGVPDFYSLQRLAKETDGKFFQAAE